MTLLLEIEPQVLFPTPPGSAAKGQRGCQAPVTVKGLPAGSCEANGAWLWIGTWFSGMWP